MLAAFQRTEDAVFSRIVKFLDGISRYEYAPLSASLERRLRAKLSFVSRRRMSDYSVDVNSSSLVVHRKKLSYLAIKGFSILTHYARAQAQILLRPGITQSKSRISGR